MRYPIPQAPFRLNPPKSPKGAPKGAPKPAAKGAGKGRKGKQSSPVGEYPPVPTEAASTNYPPVPAAAWGPTAYAGLVGPRPAMPAPEPPAPVPSAGIDFMWGSPGSWEHFHRVFVAHVLHAMYKGAKTSVKSLDAAYDRAAANRFGGRRPTSAENQAVSKQLKDLGILDVSTESLPKFPPRDVAEGRNNFFSQQARDTRASEARLQKAKQIAEAMEPGVQHIRFQSGTRQYSPTLLRIYHDLTAAQR